VDIRYYIDPETQRPHMYRTAWRSRKSKTCFDGPWRTGRGEKDRVSLWVGAKRGVIYAPDPIPDSVFVITAYRLGPKALRALPRRRRRKQ
jgi:hypothetical protein